MSTTMNSRSITDYILKLEKENSELRKVRAVLGDIDSIEESRTKIEQLKKLLTEANEEKVDALNKLNDLEYVMRTSPSYTDTTARVTKKSLNDGLVQRLLELGRMTSDFYKSMTYQKAADAVANLPYEVQSGESLMDLPGIGKGIAAKVDEYLDEQDSDYEESECSDSESIASNDEGSFVSETDDEEYFVSHNAGLAEMIYEYADRAEDNFKRDAYTKAGDTIYNLSYKITSGKDAMKLRGIGKSIAKKIDDYLTPSTNEKLAMCFLKLGNLEEPVYKSEAYWNAAEKIRDLDYVVMSGDDVRHLRGFGPSICDKIDEYINTGRMLRLEELS
jgi:DNA uptake protein ComE-like DNA-binding protein